MTKIVTSLLLFLPMAARAQDDPFGVNELNSIELGTKDLPETIAGVVNIVLGFLGILSTIIILLGGFKWMTSQGNTDKVDEAKKLIGAGVVGLVIVLAAYAIARFVLNSLVNETI
ncbi:MAG: hypothetical protein COV55_03720 [Candidatus Komeilibacteria bacterium CG11_big_fil_rev_8_21_14_0_20_36_20]|uniref:DUF4134 domain-containing protein n=1 Tax=Candidatus Komeilibacteria bacterium CG11_big_fil_rev_8_21_14_0_20_36_20 TaxID=1974477 RepID=A0A2H0NEK1_9BACT|nr:MAG: hypothetical protein COV55_03720 [Candidatus Komeilibacteria bacterium CG11_big_fil_rev_8_21_14_0_20_36_20]PIR81938.1 MAG: hypothetical protein COU21_01165 [Candidatus Komeilibacteria bacterium CG10_big_fil_rev_8_21_14_0_10_36_65]PJC55470.1 MAG: hypothetical protein CO027_01845 [Candidatus Komeilibacteria bacterium CG_4_9_14_0_2_um_filter_36_13]